MKKIFLIIPIILFANSIMAEERQGIRLALWSASGTFKFKSSDVLNGDHDHDLSGGSFGISYIKSNEDNLFFGGGWQTVNVLGPRTLSRDEIPGYWTYNHSSYGYFDVDFEVKSYRANFLYGLIGYEIEMSESVYFQPNLRIGSKSISVMWSEYYDWNSYADETYNYSESASGFGFEIDLPFMYMFDESIAGGANLCICGTTAEFYRGSYTFQFYNSNVFNLMIDFYF